MKIAGLNNGGKLLISLVMLIALLVPVYQMPQAFSSAPKKISQAKPTAKKPAAKPPEAPKLEVSQPPLSSPPPSTEVVPVKKTKSELVLFQVKDMTDEQFAPITQTLEDSAIPHRIVNLSELRTYQGNYLMLPLVRCLDPMEFEALGAYLGRGGKIVVLPPEDASDNNVQQLFNLLHIPIDTVSFASQSLDLKWSNTDIKGSIPVGSQLLTVKHHDQAKFLAMWGEDFPAIVQSDKGALLNWSWGQELTPQANGGALSQLIGLKIPASTLSLMAPNADSTLESFSFLDASGGSSDASLLATGGSAYLSTSQFEREMKILKEYQAKIDDAIETALLLDITLPVKEIQQHLMTAGMEKSKFENLYLSGKFNDAQRAYRESKRFLLDALVLTSSSPRIEGRAIWLDRGTIADSGSPQGLKKVFEKLQKAGINIIYFETVNAGFAMYPSKFTKQNPMIEGWNPLETAVKEGHKLGMEVHAWVWCFAVGNKRHNPIVGKELDYPGPILEDGQMLSEALRGSGGNLLPGGRQYEYWLSPASPKGRQLLSDLYAEIVANYDVDGLQLDYIRYPFQKPGNYMGYETVGRQRFSQSTGLNLDGFNEHTYRLWTAWKTYQVSSFVKEISERLKGIKPNVKLSAAVFPLPRASRIVAIQQDWETWIENGWIDTLSPMSYTTSAKALQKIYETVELSPKKRSLVYPGIAIHRLDAEQLLRQLEAIREKGALGSTIFAMAHLDDSKVTALADGPYKEKKTATPHKDPIQATLSIVGDYQDKFTRLLNNQELNTLVADDQTAIQQYLTGFQTAIGSLKNTAQNPNGDLQTAMTTAKANLTGLSSQTEKWLKQEKTLHPYRAQYFNELVLRLEQMLAYIGDNYSPATIKKETTAFQPNVSD